MGHPVKMSDPKLLFEILDHVWDEYVQLAQKNHVRPLLIGELNPHRLTGHRFDLYPYPPHCSGGRLCKALGLDPEDYLRRTARTNLCQGTWSKAAAAERAREIFESTSALYPMVFLGSRVCQAFRIPFAPFSWSTLDDRLVITLPHPSGRNLMWNSHEAATRARALVLPLLPPAPTAATFRS